MTLTFQQMTAYSFIVTTRTLHISSGHVQRYGEQKLNVVIISILIYIYIFSQRMIHAIIESYVYIYKMNMFDNFC